MSSEKLPIRIPFVRGSTKIVGVFGHPVAHSLSPAMHNAAFAALRLDWVYVPFAVRPEYLETALRGLPALGVAGVNLTIPHKEAALTLVDVLTPQAREVGAVNTVICQDDGQLLGDNTDGYGFLAPLGQTGTALAQQSALIFGAGGAARAVCFALAHQGARLTLVNRTRERADALAADVSRIAGTPVRVLDQEDAPGLAEVIAHSSLLVQTTQIGMHPHPEQIPDLPLNALHPGVTVYDLVYNPLETRLLYEARQRGCQTLNGVAMLVHQGARAFTLWTGHEPPTHIMEQAVIHGLTMKNPSS